MSGVFGQRFGRKKSLTGGFESSVKYCVISYFVLRQVKYVYDCVKPTFASRYITLGRVNASERNSTSGCLRFTSLMMNSQSAKGFVCGLSTRNTRTPCPIQKSKTLLSSSQSARHASPSKWKG